MSEETLENWKLRLEEKRVELEMARLELEHGFVRKNLGAIITAAVSLVAITITAFQVWIAHINSEKELKITEMENERRWKLDVFNIVSAQSHLIFSSDKDKQQRIRNVMLVTLPDDIVSALFENIEQTTTEGQVWAEGREILQVRAIEDCVGFNPQTATVAEVRGRWKIVDGSHWLFDFAGREAIARRVLEVIKHYEMNKTCFVGRPDPSFAYLLASRRAPEGAFRGEECAQFYPEELKIILENGNWQITSGNRLVLDFDNKKKEAETAAQIIRFYKFNHYCAVGDVDTFTYLRR